MKRDPTVELYRVLLMFGIVVLHAAYASRGAGSFHWLNTGTSWCVDGFVFITGYFGCRFSWKKVLCLYGTAVWCGVVIVGIMALTAKYGLLNDVTAKELGIADFMKWNMGNFVNAVIGHINGSWFLHAYVLMMCVIPIINSVASKYAPEQFGMISVPFLLAVFGWGLATELPILHRYVPHSPGLGSMTALTLLGCYISGRIYRFYEERLQFKVMPLLLGLMVLLCVDTLGYGWFGRYASPFAVFTAAVTFNLFKRIRLPAFFAKCVLLISPSMFAVYMLHGYKPCFNLMDLLVSRLCTSMPQDVALITVAVSIFLASIFVDGLRRLGLCACCRVLRVWNSSSRT